MEELGDLVDLCDEFQPVGSRVTCDPPVMDTDEDFLCLTDNWQVFLIVAARANWELGSYWETASLQNALDGGNFVSLRKGNKNILLTASKDFFKRFMAASSVAKRLNLLKKQDRIALFQDVLYGNATT